MSENNYYNYYIETLTNTMTDAIIRNVSLQASVRINEELVKELNEVVELMDAEIGTLKEQLQSEREVKNQSENSRIQYLESEISRLNSELNTMKSMKDEVENNKHQLQHIDTFRKELMSSREENEKLKDEIEYLKLSPAKRKKLDEQNTQKNTPLSEVSSINTDEQTRDGGTF